MLDFLMISTKTPKKGDVEIYPKFIIKKSNDLMTRGGDFHAVWDEDARLWMTDEDAVIRLIDGELKAYRDRFTASEDTKVKVLYMWDSDSGSMDRWHKYCQKQCRDNYHALDEKLIFSNEAPKKRDYASKTLSYPLEEGPIDNYDELMTVLYSPEERHKIEWAIGAIVAGKSQQLQKFIVLYGAPGSGKGTVLKIVSKLFEGYVGNFDAKALGSASNAFALEAFADNPLVGIQEDGDLSKLEENYRLNSLVSHEKMTVNEKYKKTYSASFNAFLFMGTNKPVKITDAKSGLLRRLIDVNPTGKKIEAKRYNELMRNIDFELGHIASHCKVIFEEDPHYYDDYVPTKMMGASNDFFNFVFDNYDIFEKNDGTTLQAAWDLYNAYAEEAKVPYPFSKKAFKEELKNYFASFEERAYIDNLRVRSWYSGFDIEKFESKPRYIPASLSKLGEDGLIRFSETESILDELLKDCPAQYANSNETPSRKWSDCKTTLKQIKTDCLHYVKIPENHIVIDFDIPDKDGKKDFEANLKAASKWPKTYAELSKSGSGIHLHYIYNGDVSKLSSVYDDHIEIKVFKGDQALRRKVTKCNDIPVATISSGLPLREESKLISFDGFKSEKALRSFVAKCLNKEHHGATKPEMDFLVKTVNDAYEAGLVYDITDMKPAIRAFALSSTNKSDICYDLYQQIHFCSDDERESIDPANEDDIPIVFYDIEVFPNLFVVVYKMFGEGHPYVKLINPTPRQIDELMKYRLVGFNNRRYDNHVIWAAHLGLSNERLYEISKGIINNEEGANFRDAFNLSYTDIYDFSSKKQSLKKFEIDLDIHHQELGLPWDMPVPEELWEKVADYCCNDVMATEATWNDRVGDWTARKILADISGGSVNDTTNTLTTKLIFGNEREPQKEFRYRNLAEPVYELDDEMMEFLKETFPEMMAEPHGEAKSLLPYFPGYKFEKGVSTYMGEKIGEGGLVRAAPGLYFNVWTFDVASEHPHSAMAEYSFGKYTYVFREVIKARVYIKHKEFDKAGELFDQKLKPYLTDPDIAKALAFALKIAINSVYGLTAAKFINAFKNPLNVDNIVAKRGALFMMDQKKAIEDLGFKAIHVKTDSIKVVEPTPELREFIFGFGKRYGYTFEVEHIFEKICLVNDAVYIAKLSETDPDWMADRDKAIADGKPIPTRWTATGAQFAVPYVFKTLFSKEEIIFKDLCETKEVKAGEIYIDLNENLPQMVTEEKKLMEKIQKAMSSNEPNALDRIMKKLNCSFEGLADILKDLEEKEANSHDLHFVGRIGQFCPIEPGRGGGVLYRVQDGKRYAVSGTSGYRWLESETVKNCHMEDAIDKRYFRGLVDDARDTISKFCDFDSFAD